MKHFDLKNRREDYATFLKYENGYYTFIMDDDDIIIFEEINKKILDDYNLKEGEFKGKKFQISFEEIMDDEDWIIFRLENIKEI